LTVPGKQTWSQLRWVWHLESGCVRLEHSGQWTDGFLRVWSCVQVPSPFKRQPDWNLAPQVPTRRGRDATSLRYAPTWGH